MERGPFFLRQQAHALFQAAVSAVDPTRLVRAALRRDGDHAVVLLDDSSELCRWRLPLAVVGAGKPAARMAAACLEVFGAASVHGCVVTADGCGADLGPIEVHEAGHPLPDSRGQAAAERILAVARGADRGLLALIGGGASSLLVAPRPPLTLADKVAVNRALLRCGADITELNIVRKHLSCIKGGGLLRAAPGPVAALLLSDVIGDDPGTIGSGPATADPTTFADARRVLEKYDLWAHVPEAARAVLLAGDSGDLEETVKPGSAAAARGRHRLLGNWRTAAEAAATAAQGAGWRVTLWETPIDGESSQAAARLGAQLRALPESGCPGSMAAEGGCPTGVVLPEGGCPASVILPEDGCPGSAVPEGGCPTCVVAGGETTVTVRGDGRGGRNQEFALALARELAGSDWLVLCAGTDGIDGPTDAAGAFVDGTTVARSRAAGLDPDVALARNDSYGFFERLGDSFRPGPTGTNVMDIVIALRPAPAGGPP